MKNVYGYIRVSGKKQEDGVSLPEQKRIIKEYARNNHLNIIHIFEETKTAAKRGRPLFTQMIKNLKAKKAEGVIIHKIDRSARNLHDWASIGDLIDNNIDVFFAHESLNLSERSGRLSADIQAVMASDYIRNLRQEAIKGLYGRLKQGIYPFAAPIGYLNNGKGKVKTVDPIKSPLIKKLFTLYVSEHYNIVQLADKMNSLGLTNINGKPVDKNGVSAILRNPFYIGLMKVKGQTFEGKHEPLVSTRTYKQTQLILAGRNKKTKGTKHFYQFRTLLKCGYCGYSLPGEMQKGNVYYRCQTKSCPTKTIREDVVEQYFKNVLASIAISDDELVQLKKVLREENDTITSRQEDIIKGYKLQQTQLKQREQKLIHAYLDNLIDKNEFENMKSNILLKIQELNEKININTSSKTGLLDVINEKLELCNMSIKLYDTGISEEKREIVKNITSNVVVIEKKVRFTIPSPYCDIANRDVLVSSGDKQDTNRTLTSQITYTDKNTSGIQPKPLNKEQSKQFINLLLNKHSLTEQNSSTMNEHDVSKNNPRSE